MKSYLTNMIINNALEEVVAGFSGDIYDTLTSKNQAGCSVNMCTLRTKPLLGNIFRCFTLGLF